jgi:2',3'-cyclic-nucleotide 2'-phosphodiesterase (5'-nucleotidase family)
VRGFLLRSLAALLACVLAWGCSRRTQEFTILHFNDYHGQVRPLKAQRKEPCGGLARLAALVQSVARAERAEGRVPILLFAGDAFTGTATSALFKGEPDFRVFAKLGIAAAAVGNHEWDFGRQVLDLRSRSLGAPVLMANARPTPGVPVFYRSAATILAGGARVGVIGVTRRDTHLITRPGASEGYTFEDPGDAVARELAKRGPRAWDFVVVLSHCGLEEDRAIARWNPGVDLIVGGHDHIALTAPALESGVPIVQAGDRGRYLGVVRVEIPPGESPRVHARLVPVTADLPEDAGIRSLLAPYLEREARELGATVCTLVEPIGDFRDSRVRETALGDLVADALRDAAGAEIGFVNGGALRADLPAGEVTAGHVLQCFPFEDTLWTMRIRGDEVKALLDRCALRATQGPWGGFLQVSGITVRYRGGRATEIRVGDAELREDATYLVACPGYLAGGGDGHLEFAGGQEKRDWGLSTTGILRSRLAAPTLEVPSAGSRILRAGAPVDSGKTKKAA